MLFLLPGTLPQLLILTLRLWCLLLQEAFLDLQAWVRCPFRTPTAQPQEGRAGDVSVTTVSPALPSSVQMLGK